MTNISTLKFDKKSFCEFKESFREEVRQETLKEVAEKRNNLGERDFLNWLMKELSKE